MNNYCGFYLRCIATLLLVLSLNTAQANTADNQPESVTVYEHLSQRLEQQRINHKVPAMAVAILSAGELVYCRGFGFADAAQTQPTTKNTLFRVASISKLFTAQAVMQLLEQYGISVQDPIGKFVPDFNGSPITIQQLLTHSSGIQDQIKPRPGPLADEQEGARKYVQSVLATTRQRPNAHEFNYSDTGFNLLGAFVSAVSGKNYSTYVDERLLQKARMDASYFARNDSEGIAFPSYQGQAIPLEHQRPFDPQFFPSEGLVSSITDLSRWLQLTLKQDKALLHKSGYHSMLQVQGSTGWHGVEMGLGWQLVQDGDHRIARHPGSIRGYKSLIMAYPDRQDGFILLSNSSDTPRWEIAQLITEMMKNSGIWQ